MRQDTDPMDVQLLDSCASGNDVPQKPFPRQNKVPGITLYSIAKCSRP